MDVESDVHKVLSKAKEIVTASFVTYCLDHGCLPSDMAAYRLSHQEMSELDDQRSRKVQTKTRPLDSPLVPSDLSVTSNTTFSSLSGDSLAAIMHYLPTELGLGLWHFGDKSIRQKLAHIRTTRLVPPVTSSFDWPATALSFFTHASDVTVACPEYYEHMPFNHFNALDLPLSIRVLTLDFRNAPLLFKQVGVLRDSFPHLESLKMRGIDGPKICFSTSSNQDNEDENLVTITPKDIAGICILSLPKIEIALSDIDFLPQSLIELSTIHISESGDSTPDFIPRWPLKLESLSLDANVYGGAVLGLGDFGINSSTSLLHLRFICVQAPSNPRLITDECISHLPSKLNSLEIRIGGPHLMEPNDIAASPLTGALLSLLPETLESLEVWRWPVPIDFGVFPDALPNITRLRISEPSEDHTLPIDHSLLPRGITDLKIPSPFVAADDEGLNETLDMLPPSLTRLSMNDLHPEQIQRLPRTITDLELNSTLLRDDEWVIDAAVDVEEQAPLFPPLKKFWVQDPGFCCGEDINPWPFDQLLPNLEYMHVNSHRVFSKADPTNLFVGKHWKHYSDGPFLEEEKAWPNFVERLPRSLKSYRLPFYLDIEVYEREGFSMIEKLPRGLTALSLAGFAGHLPAEYMSMLPPHLTFLEFPSQRDFEDLSPGDLPATLRIIACSNAEEIPAEVLPPFCRAIVPCPGVDDPMLNGEWWRGSEYDDPLLENEMA